MKAVGKFLLFIFATITIVVTIAGFYVYQQFQQQVPISLNDLEEVRMIKVVNGENAKQLIERLYEQGDINNSILSQIYLRMTGKDRLLRAGTFLVPKNLNHVQFFDFLLSAKQITKNFTILEGEKVLDLLTRLQKVPSMNYDLDARDAWELAIELDLKQHSAEGMFLAETYQYVIRTVASEFLKRAAEALTSELERQQATRKIAQLPLNDAYEVVKLASIVEAEALLEAELPIIAGVFIKRLAIDMRLEADPTVIYGMGDEYKGRIRRKHLLADTPWNTYTRGGLPATPIGMPSARSIAAVLHPDMTGALFFVAKGDGSHHFSFTQSEHVQAVRTYILGK